MRPYSAFPVYGSCCDNGNEEDVEHGERGLYRKETEDNKLPENKNSPLKNILSEELIMTTV